LRTSAHRSVRSAWSPAADGLIDAQYASNWFAVYTASRHEKRVAQHLGQRQIEFYLPLYRSARKWSDGSRVTLELPLFPGYIFVHINRAERVRVLCVPGALAVVGGNGREPLPLPDEAIEALRSGLHLHPVEPHPLLTVGQRARIRTDAAAHYAERGRGTGRGQSGDPGFRRLNLRRNTSAIVQPKSERKKL